MKKLLILILFIPLLHLQSQSLNGTEGMLYTPTAETAGDGVVRIGASFLNKEILPSSFRYDGLAYYISIGFLPFIESGIRFSKNLGPLDALGDRMLILKIKFIAENKYLPAIAFGMQDFFYTKEEESNRFNSTYLVITKNFHPITGILSAKLNLGYGFRLISAKSYQYMGLFGGISLSFFSFIELMGEYDAERFNAGLRLTLFKHIKLLGGFMDMKHLSGGAAVSWEL